MKKIDRIRKSITEKTRIKIRQLYEEAPNEYVLITSRMSGDEGLSELGLTVTDIHDSQTQSLRPAIDVHFTDKEGAVPLSGLHGGYITCGACRKPLKGKAVEGGPIYGFRFYNLEDGSLHYCPKWSLNAENNMTTEIKKTKKLP